ncbi:MAG: glycosyltransferase family 2 protein [Microthrixaceae bacterium]|nr:glycosyltransferase family 2 protein [Microthrixaceae bacterium]
MLDQASAERADHATTAGHDGPAVDDRTDAPTRGRTDDGGAELRRPPVSVVICTVDRPVLLRAAIESIVAQRYDGPIETFVVYDGTTPDETLNSSDPLRPVTVMPNTHRKGLPAGRNCGAEAATGEFLGFCDDDDTWLPEKAETQVRLLEAHPESDAVVCGMEVDHRGTIVPRPLTSDAITMGDLLDDRVMEVEFVTTLVRREAFLDPDRLGGADEEIPGGYAEDYEFVLRAARRHPLPTSRAPLVRKGWGGGSLFAERWRTIDNALDYLLDRFPEFAEHPRGHGRVLGQRAFAAASAGDRDEARSLIRATLAADWRQPRAWLALGVWARLLRPDRVVAFLNARGRGI